MITKTLYSDSELIPHIKKGNKEAFEIIFHRYKSKLFYFAFSYVHSKPDTEEIIQNVFVSFWEHRYTLNEELSIKNYLYKSIINGIYNYFKHKSVEQRFIDYSLLNSIKQDDSLQNNLYLNELQDTINSLISQLPTKQQQIFKMSRFQGLSHNDIAKKLGLSVRSVENQVYRALKFLKDNLKEEYISISSSIVILFSAMF